MKRTKVHQHIVKGLAKKEFLLEYCIEAFPQLGSKTAVKKALAAGRIRKGNRIAKARDMVSNGDKIVLEIQEKQLIKQPNLKLDIPLVYEDEHLIVVNKPGGIAVNGNRNKTVENALAAATKRSTEADALVRPTAAHRLDVPTKGLLVLAKTKRALVGLNRQFQEGSVQKAYQAVVHGKIMEQGAIDLPIDGKPALTEFRRLEVMPSRVFGYLSLVHLQLHTGRTHQLRLHLRSQGHLIVGDKLYAEGQKTILGKGLFLCSCELSFRHPIRGESMAFSIAAPSRFQRLLEEERERL